MGFLDQCSAAGLRDRVTQLLEQISAAAIQFRGARADAPAVQPGRRLGLTGQMWPAGCRWTPAAIPQPTEPMKFGCRALAIRLLSPWAPLWLLFIVCPQ